MNLNAKGIVATVSLTMACCIMWRITGTLHANDPIRRLSEARPPIYTFYSPLVRALDTPREQRTRKADKELLEAWKSAWHDAGWDPNIITLEDAKRHPAYDAFTAKVQQTKLLGAGGRNSEYNEYCFLRFLAMAFIGGGTMADYDLFPLSTASSSPAIPTPQRFTVYQQTLNKAGPVPALCSGTSMEWERIAQAIIDISQQASESGWSDMTALMHLYKTQPDSMVVLDQVLGSNELEKSPSAHERCRLASHKNAWGVHFSHYDVLQSGHKVFERPTMATNFVQKWKRDCDESGVK
jgi:hypothetical protein